MGVECGRWWGWRGTSRRSRGVMKVRKPSWDQGGSCAMFRGCLDGFEMITGAREGLHAGWSWLSFYGMYSKDYMWPLGRLGPLSRRSEDMARPGPRSPPLGQPGRPSGHLISIHTLQTIYYPQPHLAPCPQALFPSFSRQQSASQRSLKRLHPLPDPIHTFSGICRAAHPRWRRRLTPWCPP